MINRLSKAKISSEQQHRVLENKKQQEVMEKDKEFQESIQTKQRELIKKKVLCVSYALQSIGNVICAMC